MVIVGTVVGSGFLSGKEIVVFFSRFGKASYFCIFLAFLLFFALFYFFLRFGTLAINRLMKSKFAFSVNIIICFILSAAMFAGIYVLIKDVWMPLRLIIMFIVLCLALKVALKGSFMLDKLNLVLVPIMAIFMIINLINMLSFKMGTLFQGKFLPFSALYCVLYIFLNTANSAVVISSYSNSLSAKQKVQVSFYAALALFCILFFANTVLLQNSYSFGQEMPLLYIADGFQKLVLKFIIFLGCCTTLFSLVFSLCSSLKVLSKNKVTLSFFSVILPFLFSFLGFGMIVCYLYPLTSVLGIFLICDMFLIPIIKKRLRFSLKKVKKK